MTLEYGIGLVIGIGILALLLVAIWYTPAAIRRVVGDRRIDRAWPVAIVVLPAVGWLAGGLAAAATMLFITGLGWAMWVNHR